MPTTKRTALVTGASGLAGGYMLAHLLEQGGWDIVAVSRRKPRIPGDYRHIAVDLLDPADCRAKLGPLTNISHLFYSAITERPDPSETVSANSNMLSCPVDPHTQDLTAAADRIPVFVAGWSAAPLWLRSIKPDRGRHRRTARCP
jgi:NAD(P)-dependent dehydrogenase (short-subunit alcohol dehydrogenase family)